MKPSKEKFFIFLISWLIYLLQLSSVLCLSEKKCSLYNPICEENETCVQIENNTLNEGHCACKRGSVLVNNKCVAKPGPVVPVQPTTTSAIIDPDPHKSGGASGTLWVLIPCLLFGAIGALILVSRRYKLMERLYSLRLRRYNTVFVSSLNDDDAPIT